MKWTKFAGRGAKGDRFSVRHVYNVLQPCNSLDFPAKGIWIPNPPTKTSIFAW